MDIVSSQLRSQCSFLNNVVQIPLSLPLVADGFIVTIVGSRQLTPRK